MTAPLDMVEFEPPDRELLIRDAQTFLADAKKHFAITDTNDYHAACADLKCVKQRQKAIDADCKHRTKPLSEKLDEIRDSYRDAKAFLKDAEQILKGVIDAYDRRQAEIREGERRRLLAEQRAEQQRIDNEARARREAGDHAIADKLERQIAETPPPTVEKLKHEGISFRDHWRVIIEDVELIPRSYMVPDLRRLNDLARSQMTEFNVPGARAVCERIVASRT